MFREFRRACQLKRPPSRFLDRLQVFCSVRVFVTVNFVGTFVSQDKYPVRNVMMF